MTDRPKAKDIGYVVPQTHWDREWRYPLWKNRMLLVELMEELLQILDTQPGYRCFLFDGQVAPIEDYLEVVPEHREKVTKYIEAGPDCGGPVVHAARPLSAWTANAWSATCSRASARR